MYRILNTINRNEDKYYRKNSPKTTLYLWKRLEEIGYELNKKQFINRLFTNGSNDQFWPSLNHLKTIIDNCLAEKLIVSEMDDKNGFRLRPLKDKKQFFGQTNDWYCFGCHSCDANRALIQCNHCFRAFHMSCLKKTSTEEPTEQTVEDMEFQCDYCRRMRLTSDGTEHDIDSQLSQLSAKESKDLIKNFFRKIEKSFINFDIYSEYSLERSAETDVLLFYYMDLKLIRSKVQELDIYSTFTEFESDLRHFCHNFCIINDESILQPFVENIDYELNELNRCLQCYRYSRALPGEELAPEEWFTRVCVPPHRLVYAKYKSWPFWPSKVIEWTDGSDSCLVQFFEPKLLSRANVSKDKVRDIEHKMESKQLTCKQMLGSTALLIRYLKNLKDSEPDFKYDKLLTRLVTLVAKKSAKNKNSVMNDLNIDCNDFNVKKNNQKPTKKRSSQVLDSEDSDESLSQSQSQIDIGFKGKRLKLINDKDSDSDSDSDNEVLNTNFGKILDSNQIPLTTKLQLCSLVIKKFSNNLNCFLNKA